MRESGAIALFADYNNPPSVAKEMSALKRPSVGGCDTRELPKWSLLVASQQGNTSDPRLIVIRSFDINKPGAEVDDFQCGVAGGSILTGVLRLGTEVEIHPQIVTKDSRSPPLLQAQSLSLCTPRTITFRLDFREV
ncbi:hypothetical protein EV702DRAFT_180954 [Suillus placidus]|uniref:Uncharacterized protein n=1 Tax=Suillus placidus TaxID=48579 RepID=A0A9P6ZXA5_9AGAM|nr:hypothetical protein EV702DRAFT_180954 [Suillus placidus]